MSLINRNSKKLQHLLDDPNLITKVQQLSTTELATLAYDIGLEDAGEILALATTEQLLNVIDMDVWQNERIGEDETFDSDRFLLWLEILLEAGEKALIARLEALPDDLVVMAFYAHILVLNLDDMALENIAPEETVDLTDKALSNCLCHEMAEYLIIARQSDGWDTLLTAIVALDERNPDLLQHILSMCCYASSEYIMENGGLYHVLTAEEMLYTDAAADRADRRARYGYVSPSDATAFLKLAVSSSKETHLSGDMLDPISRAYFREWKGTPIIPGTDSISEKEAFLYLANVLSAAFGTTEGPVRPADAMHTVFLIYKRGLRSLNPNRLVEDTKADRGTAVIAAFMLGWQSLFSSHHPGSITEILRAATDNEAPLP